jgi:hypothetical protein
VPAAAIQTPDTPAEIKSLREAGTTVPQIMQQMGRSKASINRALSLQFG